ncbi:glycine cleavage system protein R [Knoellia aerolata]|uniref:Amino acid-binding ACT protein n=1 Tax=Knoellia aerolata DSM 18566 TaxID=1385519 RepID=A0A0A0K127_9MICO|nr:ACT domain-containing protein [Knoellia aerolata]KGN41481.1 amino acid-binding ACT protein [Knoellia aerolata DSM 18566]
MTTLVLTVIGDDRAGLVKALADVIAEGGGNWERSHLSELGGKFAGIVLVTVPEDRADALRAALAPLEGLLDVSVHSGSTPSPGEAADPDDLRHVRIELLGNDRPGIVGAVSGVLARHGLSVASLESVTRDAPMAGGRLFDARAVVTVPRDVDLALVQTDLEEIASEIMVEVSLSPDEG